MQVSAYNNNNRLRAAITLLLFGTSIALFAAGCGGGGGGGGGGSNGGPVATVSGMVFSASSDTPPAGAASIVIGGTTLTSNPADGTFSGNVPSTASSATVSAGGEVSRTISVSLSSSQVNNLGTIFLADTGSDYSANVNGVVVTTLKGGALQPVGGATVNIGNVTGISKIDGTFSLSGLPVGLGSVNGLYGTITASGFAVKLITADVLGFALVSGNNNIGNMLLATASGSTPNPPYTVSGVVNVAGKPTSGVTVAISLPGGGSSLGQTQTDSNGNYFFWVAPATYQVAATDISGNSGGATVTLKSLAAPVTAPVINLAQ